ARRGGPPGRARRSVPQSRPARSLPPHLDDRTRGVSVLGDDEVVGAATRRRAKPQQLPVPGAVLPAEPPRVARRPSLDADREAGAGTNAEAAPREVDIADDDRDVLAIARRSLVAGEVKGAHGQDVGARAKRPAVERPGPFDRGVLAGRPAADD